MINTHHYELFKMNILYYRVGEYKEKDLRMLIKMYNIDVNSKLSRPLLLEKLSEYFYKFVFMIEISIK